MATYKIGRAEGNHIVLADKSVSRQHAELEELGAGRFRLKDVGSSSGTQMLSGEDWVDVSEAEVRHDTRIRFGEYETTPMDLVRDMDKTMVQARPSPAAKPEAPKPAPPRPAPPRPAAPKAAAPKPAPRPAPAAPRPAGAGGGVDKTTMWIILGGGGALLLIALIAVVVVLVTGGEDRVPDMRVPDRTEVPRQDATPQLPRTETPPVRRDQPAQAGPQRLTQACRTWQGVSEAACACIARAVQPVLQSEDYDAAIAIMGLIFTDKGDEARQMVQQVAQQDQGRAQRIVQAVQAIGRDCKGVQ